MRIRLFVGIFATFVFSAILAVLLFLSRHLLTGLIVFVMFMATGILFFVAGFRIISRDMQELEDLNKEHEEEAKKNGKEYRRLTQKQIDELGKQGFTLFDNGTPLFKENIIAWHSKKDRHSRSRREKS